MRCDVVSFVGDMSEKAHRWQNRLVSGRNAKRHGCREWWRFLLAYIMHPAVNVWGSCVVRLSRVCWESSHRPLALLHAGSMIATVIVVFIVSLVCVGSASQLMSNSPRTPSSRE